MENITPKVIVLKTSYLFMKNYNYLVVDPAENESVIVDPAWQLEVIEDAMAQSCAVLSGILLTHSHPDHVHLAEPLAARYDCPIWMSHREIAASGFRAERLIGIDETPWSVGCMRIQPLVTPGHTMGATCYLIGDNLFTGDTLFAEGCGICTDNDAAYALFDSLEYLKRRLAPQTRIYPGHSYGRLPGQKFSDILRENMYLQFVNKHAFAAYRLRKGQDALKFVNFS